MMPDTVPMEVETQAASLPAGESQAASQAKSGLRRLTSKAPPTQDYLSQIIWTDEERKERMQLLSKHFRSLPDAPRPPRSAWLIYCCEFYVKKGSSSSAVMSEAGKAWHALSKAERLPYDQSAQAEKDQAKADTEKFKSTDEYQALSKEIDKFVLINRARKEVKKPVLSWKEWKLQQSKLAKASGAHDAKENAKEAKAVANCVNRIALKLAAAARRTNPETALPTPPKSGFSLYSSAVMGDLYKAEKAKGKVDLSALMKKVATDWAALAEDQKASYVTQAREDTQRYAKEIVTFKASDTYRAFLEKAQKLYDDSRSSQSPGEEPKPIAQILKEAEEKARKDAKLQKKREAIQSRLISCIAGSANGPPKAPGNAYALFGADNREKALKEVAGGSGQGDAKMGGDGENEDEEKEDEVEEPEEPEEDEDEEDEDEKPKKKKSKKAKGAKGGSGKEKMEMMAKAAKHIAVMWNALSEGEKAKYKEKEADLKKKYVEELAAWKTTEAFKSFAMEVDQWQQTEEAQATKKPNKSFKTWKQKKLQKKRAADKLADRERIKAEKLAARERAKFEKAAGKKKAKAGGKPGAPEPEVPAVELPPLLEKDPFWDDCFSNAEALLEGADAIIGDRIVWAAAQKGGAAGMELLRKMQRLPDKASTFFRRRSADCAETPLHHALLSKDMEMIQLFAKEMDRSGNANMVPQSVVNGIMQFGLAVGDRAWYWPQQVTSQGLVPRTGASEQDGFVHHGKETAPGLKRGDAVLVKEIRGTWIRTDLGWFPLMLGNNVQFAREDPKLTQPRTKVPNAELQPVSTGMARGRAFRAKKLRKVNLSRGGAEGNQAFVKDMYDDYVQPRPRVKDAMEWAVRKGLDFQTLAAACELFRGGRECQATDFLGTAVRSGRWELAGELVAQMGVGDLYGLNPQHRLALLPEPSDEEFAEMAKRKASITKKSVDNFEIMPIHCACINAKSGKAILEAMLAQLGPAAEDQCKDSELRTLVHYAAVCETEEPLEVLLSSGMSPHRADAHGLTALMLACMANRPRCVARLLAAKADPMARYQEKNSFHLAVRAGATEALHELVAHMSKAAGAEPAPPPAKKGKKAPKKPKPSWQLAMSSSQRNALHEACAAGNMDMAFFLLDDAPATMHKVDKQGRSPLTLAVMNGHTMLASHLLHRRAIVDRCDTSGNSPLHYALAYGWKDLADLLVKCGHDPDMQNRWRNAPVDVALLKSHSGLAAWYVSECPIQPDSLDEKGRTLLSRACVSLTGPTGKTWRILLQALVEKRGANVNLPDGQGDLPICLAAHACRSSSSKELNDSLKILCAAKADVGRRAEKGQFQGQSAISIALRGTNSGLLRLMLESGAGVAAHGRGETLLHALPERLIRMSAWNPGEEKSAADIFETICACVPAEALKGMATTMEQFGLLPLHSAILHFNQAITGLAAAKDAKANELQALQNQLQTAMLQGQNTTISQIRHAITAKEPELAAATRNEEAGRADFQKCMAWLMDTAGADLLAQVGELEKPWNDVAKPDASKRPPGLPAKLTPVGPSPEHKEVVERSVPAHALDVYYKYHPSVGLTTPLMFLIQSGDSPSVKWFLDELTKRGVLEAALKSSTLFGITPLAIAVQRGSQTLSEDLLFQLASPGAVAVRQYDGRTALHLATAGGASNWSGNLREGNVDPRVVAFQAALEAAKAAGTVDAADALGKTALCTALSATGPAMPKLLQQYPMGLYGGQLVQKDAEITAVEMEMYKAFQGKEKEMLSGQKLLAPDFGSGPAQTLNIAGMGNHIKWGFDDQGAYVSAIKNPVAETNGIKVGMRLTAIDGQSLSGMVRQQIQAIYSQKKGATGMLTFESPGGAPSSFGQPVEAKATAPAAGFSFSPNPGQPAGGLVLQPSNALGQPAFGAPAFGAPAFGAPAFGSPAFGAPAFGAPAFRQPAFGAPAAQAAPAFGAFGGGGIGAAVGMKQMARKARFQAGGFGAPQVPGGGGAFGQPQPAAPAQQASAPEPASLAVSAPGIVRSADACFYSLDQGIIRAVPCQLTQGRWHFELCHTYLKDVRIGFAVTTGRGSAEVKWLTDKRPWPTNGTVGVAVDCDAGTGFLVVDNQWGSATTLAAGPGSSYTPVISGVGMCTINFGNPRNKDFGDLPFMALKEAVQKPSGASRLVHALLDAGASPKVPNVTKPKENQLTLHTAAQNDDAASIRFLCEKGAQLSLASPLSGRSALHLATSGGFLGVAAALVLARADVNQADPKELQGHVGASLYAPRPQAPRLCLHQAVATGTDAFVGLLTRAGADVSVTIETRSVVTTKIWLPVPPPLPPKSESEPAVDPFRKAGTNVGMPAAVALELLRGLGVAAEPLEKAMKEVQDRAKKLGVETSPMFCGCVGHLPKQGEDESLFAIDSGDFGSSLASLEKKKPLLVTREKLMYYTAVESIKKTYAQPLQKAAARNRTAMVQVLLKASADPAAVDTSDGRQALHHAVAHLNTPMVQLLLNFRAPLDVTDETSNKGTPLYYAVTAATQDKASAREILEALLNAKASIDLPCCSSGFTPLHLAAAARHLKVLEQLLRHGASPCSVDPERRTPLHIAVNSATASEPSFDAERLLLNAKAEVNAVDIQGRMPLHYAFVKKEKQLDASPADPVETVTSLCAVEGVRVDVPDEFGATPLLCAARRGATISSLYLSKRGASLKARDKSGNDTLGVALAGGHHQYAITLLSQGAGDVEAPMCHLQTQTIDGKRKVIPGPPLSLFREATSHKQLGLSYLLLDHGYPFHGAIQDSLELGEFRLVLTLLSKINPSENAVVQRLDRHGRSLHHALAGFPKQLGPEATEIAEELNRRGVALGADSKQRWPLHLACANAHKDLSRWLVRQDAGAAKQLDAEGQCPVHAVCTRSWLWQLSHSDHLVFLDMLLPLNKDASYMTFRDTAGATADRKRLEASGLKPAEIAKELGPEPEVNVPLVNIARVGFRASVERLLEARADPNQKDGRNNTSLCGALQCSGSTVKFVVQSLLFAAADANERDGRGNTPLRYAIRRGSKDLIMDLARAKARVVDAPSEAGGSVVLDALALSSGSMQPVLTTLLDLRALPDQGVDDRGRPALLVAVDGRMAFATNALLSAKASATAVDRKGRSALSSAIEMAAWKVADELLRAGADPHKGLDKKGHGPLLAATLAGNPALVRHLLQAKASTSSAGQDEKGRGVLSIAVLDNNKEVVDELLNAKADPSHQDKDGRNALHHCIQPFAFASYECTRLLAAMLRTPGGLQAAQVPDKKGLTPVALASRQGSGRMAQVLSTFGLQVTVHAPTLAAPSAPKPDVDADARRELEKVEATAKPTPIPVHKAYSMSGENKVFAEKKGEEYDALLFKVDLKRDEMRFYHLQLVHETNKDLFVLFTRWGEIGETGMFQRTPAANKEEGLKDFSKVFKEKTGNVWDPTGATFERKPNKYQLLRRRRATARSEELVLPFDFEKSARSSLPRMVWRTLDAICDPQHILQAVRSMGIKTQSMPFGSLSRATLDEARSLLGEIRESIAALKEAGGARHKHRAFGFARADEVLEASKKRNEVRERILDLSSRYYELVPRGAGTVEVARPIESDDALAKEFEQLLNLTEASVGIQTLLAAHHHAKDMNPMDYCQRAIGVAFEQVKTDSDEFKLLMDYMCATAGGAAPTVAKPGDIVEEFGKKRPNSFKGHRHGDVVTAIYRISRSGEEERFKDIGNRRLLWHGSRRSNFVSILTQGLRVAPPEAPVQGYMYGKGIYFADMFCKSRAYTACGSGDAAYMLLCDVALGNMFPSHMAHYMEQPQAGTNSTWGVGGHNPGWANSIYEPGGAQLPKDAKSGGSSTSLGHNEFIVYDPAQVRMRYLIELNNFESPSEKLAREKAEAEARGESHPAKKLKPPTPPPQSDEEEEDDDEEEDSDCS